MDNSKISKIAIRSSNKDYCSVTGGLYCVLKLSQLILGAPIRFKKYSKGWRVRFSWYLSIVTVLFTVFFDVCFVITIVIDLASRVGGDREPLVTYYAVRSTSLLSVLITASVAGYGAPRRFKSIIRCLNRLQKINLERNIISRNEHNLLMLCLSYITFNVALLVLENYRLLKFGRSLMTDNVVRLHTISYCAALWTELTTLIFTCTALEIFGTLKSMNDQLEELFLQLQKGQAGFTLHRRISQSTFIRTLSSSYNDLCMIIEDLNAAFGLELASLLMNSFIFIIIVPHHIFHLLSTQYKENILERMLWLVVYASRLLLIIEPCHMTQQEMDRTSLLVGKLSMENMDTQCAMELEKFTHYLLGHKVSYAPLALCTLSRRLLTTIVTNVTTYLVILIQFQLLDLSRVH